MEKHVKGTGKHYDYLLVGGGLFNGIIAHEAGKQGKSCLVVEKRSVLGGNIHCREVEGIMVHEYGAHIFHTSNRKVWDYVSGLVEFNHYINSPVANYHGEIYNLPFNMNTFSKMWGIRTPQEAREIIESQRKVVSGEPKNLEEQAISQVGTDVYEKLVKGYTMKQWGRECKDLPASIIKRLPVRYIYDNNYFNDPYQGIPKGGYNGLIEKLYDGCDVILDTDYLEEKEELSGMADQVIYTGTIDSYFDYCYGKLEYRTLRFEHELLNESNHQGVAVMNYTDGETPYTRKIEHKHFDFGTQEKTVVSKEYPAEWTDGMEPYYPVNDEKNSALYARYQELGEKEEKVFFGGRLGEYKYYDMDKVIESALKFWREKLQDKEKQD